MNTEIVGIVKQTPQILSTIYCDLAQPSVKKIGAALETVFEFSASFLLPLKLLNEKFRMNFEKRLNEYKQKIENIPDGELCEVNPQIGIPLLQKLSYTTNDEIANLFTNLLAKASWIKTVNMAHPSFVQLIERLSLDEAKIITSLNHKSVISLIPYTLSYDSNIGKMRESGKILHFKIELLFPLNASMYVDNLCSMGILAIKPRRGIWVGDKHEEYKKMITDYFISAAHKKSYSVHLENLNISLGWDIDYEITDFGRSFINTCISNK